MMDTTDIIRLLNTDHYSPANLEEVNDLCRNYPMFNVGHMLKLRILEALGRPIADQVPLTAVYASDRGRLFQLIQEVSPKESVEEIEVREAEEAPIQFSEESNPEADVIIFQHAPYAAAEPEENLLILDEEGTNEPFSLVDEEQVEKDQPQEDQPQEDQAIKDQPQEDEPEIEAGESPVGQEEDNAEKERESLESSDVHEELTTTKELEADQEETDQQEADQKEADQEEADQEEDELTSETLIKAVVKDDTDMEEPEVPEIPQVDVVEKEQRESENQRLIERFIHGDAGPIRADAETRLKGDVSVASIREHDGLITDTLAKIYVKQGLYAKAIYAYEKLSLKYPEKSAYFAAQIEKIKNINQS